MQNAHRFSLSPEAIRESSLEYPKLREREIAHKLRISEAELIAAWCGHHVSRLHADFEMLIKGLEKVGKVMALTRNESAVHEKIGRYDRYIAGKHASMMLGAEIDMRMFPKHWVHFFAVEKTINGTTRHSIQIFDEYQEAVHKIYTHEETNLAYWNELIAQMRSQDQSQTLTTKKIRPDLDLEEYPVSKTDLEQRWLAMTDTHQFVKILHDLNISRYQAVHHAPAGFAWQLAPESIHTLLCKAVDTKVPIMCFVANRGNIQIHSGEIETVKVMGPWLNILDPTFNLHLRSDHIKEIWVVKKPTDKGHVTSVEAYDSEKNLIIQFYGKRIEGHDEREVWRGILESLPLN